jgi:hypothetical protein
MPATSADRIEEQDFGPVSTRTTELDGITIDYLTVKGELDMGPMLASLPDGRCQCPHWGIVTKGGFVVRYADHEEKVGPGDAFHMTRGHVPVFESATELVMFSPTDELKATDEAIQRAMAAQPQ